MDVDRGRRASTCRALTGTPKQASGAVARGRRHFSVERRITLEDHETIDAMFRAIRSRDDRAED